MKIYEFKTCDPIQKLEHELLITLYGLDNLRRTLPLHEWEIFCKTQTVNHPLHKLLLNDPITRRGFEKPRGYAGDPVMLDYIFGYRTPPDIKENPIGSSIFNFTFTSDPAEAIRYRRKFLAQVIDDTSDKSSRPISVLSIASGHIREAELSSAINNRSIKRFVVFDQDKVNLDVVESQYSHLGILPIQGMTKDLPAYSDGLGEFDLIYTADLLNHLNKYSVIKLIKWMFEALNAKGYLLISNFRKEVPNTLFRTYLEAFMQAFIKYRTDAEIIELFSGLDHNQIEEFKLLTDPLCNLNFVLIRKR